MIAEPTHAQHIEALEEMIRALKTERAVFIQERMEDHARRNAVLEKVTHQWRMRTEALERENRRLARELDDQERYKSQVQEQVREISRLKDDAAQAAVRHVDLVTFIRNLRKDVKKTSWAEASDFGLDLDETNRVLSAF